MRPLAFHWLATPELEHLIKKFRIFSLLCQNLSKSIKQRLNAMLSMDDMYNTLNCILIAGMIIYQASTILIQRLAKTIQQNQIKNINYK